jgi:hypothetical protein
MHRRSYLNDGHPTQIRDTDYNDYQPVLDSNQSPRGSIDYVEHEGVDGGTLMDESRLGQNEAGSEPMELRTQ